MGASPKAEWQIISRELSGPAFLLLNFLLPLAIVSVLPKMLFWFFSARMFSVYVLWTILAGFFTNILTVFLLFFPVHFLSIQFGALEGKNKASRLVAYASIPLFLAEFVSVIPYISWLVQVAGWLFFIYLFYLGTGPMLKIPVDKKIVFTIVSIFVAYTIKIVLSSALSFVFRAVVF